MYEYWWKKQIFFVMCYEQRSVSDDKNKNIAKKINVCVFVYILYQAVSFLPDTHMHSKDWHTSFVTMVMLFHFYF